MKKKILLACCGDYANAKYAAQVCNISCIDEELKDLIFGEEVIDSESLKKLTTEELQRRKERKEALYTLECKLEDVNYENYTPTKEDKRPFYAKFNQKRKNK